MAGRSFPNKALLAIGASSFGAAVLVADARSERSAFIASAQAWIASAEEIAHAAPFLVVRPIELHDGKPDDRRWRHVRQAGIGVLMASGAASRKVGASMGEADVGEGRRSPQARTDGLWHRGHHDRQIE